MNTTNNCENLWVELGSNSYLDTGVRDLEVSCFKANSTWINDIGSKDLSNKPIYAVLNTHNLDMILEPTNQSAKRKHVNRA